MAAMKLSEAGFSFLRNAEGEVGGLYDDSSGYCTYGVGYLVHKKRSYLLKAARSLPAFSSYVKKWPKMASVLYLDRSVRLAPKFNDLKNAALGTGAAKAAAQAYVNPEVNILGSDIGVLFRQKVPAYESSVNSSIKIPLTQNEFDPLVSLCYNIGAVNFKGSTAVKLINEGKFKTGDASVRKTAIDQIDAAIKMWNKSGDVFVQGLADRRAQEASMFLKDARAELDKLQTKKQAGAFAAMVGKWQTVNYAPIKMVEFTSTKIPPQGWGNPLVAFPNADFYSLKWAGATGQGDGIWVPIPGSQDQYCVKLSKNVANWPAFMVGQPGIFVDNKTPYVAIKKM